VEGGEGSWTRGEAVQYDDVLPRGGRLVLFMSGCVEHEVRPANVCTRMLHS